MINDAQLLGYLLCIKPMAQHSAYNLNFKGRVACGFPLIPFRSKIDGPASQGFQNLNGDDIIEQAYKYFRLNVLFKNFEIKGPGDKVLIYLLVLISHLFRCTESIKDMQQAIKKLTEIYSLSIPLPKDKGNFLAPVLQDGSGNERNVYLQYVKQLKAQTINRFAERFYKDGLPVEDFKFWSGLARKKFMGMNFVSMY